MQVSDWTYFSPQYSSLKLSCSRYGYIATSSHNIFSIYKKTEKGIIPISSAKKCKNIITCHSWYQECDLEGEMPLRIFFGTQSGKCFIFDVPTFDIISHFAISNSPVTSIEWSNIHKNYVFIGCENGNVISGALLDSPQIGQPAITIFSSITCEFPIEFICINQNDNNSLIVGSKNGSFELYSNIYEKSPKKILSGNLEQDGELNIIQCGFLPHINDAFYLISTNSIYLGFAHEKSTISIFPTISFQQIIGTFFPKNDENAMIIIQSGSIILLKFILEKGWKKIMEIPQFNSPAESFCVFDESSFIFTTRGNNLYRVKYFKNKLFVCDFMRHLVKKPTQIAVNNSFFAFIVNDDETNFLYLAPQLTYMTEYCLMYNLNVGEVNQIEWISDTDLIISTQSKNKDRQNLYFFNYEKRQLISILRPQLELVTGFPMHFHIQSNQEYFAVTVCGNALSIYKIQQSEKPIEIVFTILSENGASSFAGNENFLIFYKDRVEHYSIQPFSLINVIKITAMNISPIIASALTLDFSLICFGNDDVAVFHNKIKNNQGNNLTTNNSLVLDQQNNEKHFNNSEKNDLLENGEEILNKYQIIGQISSPSYIKVASDNISSIIQGKDDCIIITYISENRIKLQFPKSKIQMVDYVSNSIIFVNKSCSHSFTFKNIDDLTPIDTPHIIQKINQKPFHQFLEKIQNETDPEKVAQISSDMNLFYLQDVINSACSNCDSRCFGINMNQERILNLLRSVSYLFEQTHSSIFQRREIVYKKLIGDNLGTFSSLLNTNRDDINFTKNVMKAVLISLKLNEQNLEQTLSSLSKNGCDEDVTDLLFHRGRYFEAAMNFLKDNELEYAILATKLILNEKEQKDMISIIVSYFKNNDMSHHIAPFLMGMHCFEEAANYLKEQGKINSYIIVRSLYINEENHAQFSLLRDLNYCQ
ncbi:hypothetical protein TRFO_09996 [Tritrichomonas foetus]|uniref:Uncharacterized protein n=1 Tax=Tritrichomonas foetus TaxID=1144522 RepID=A0A1J4JFC3_9EUKA|nr:hypothetical protein TRFO_09996 [Tritrichomonas foetus]|eukprot:OHS96347.1 hypothetical protein TRFO_09996 [Tritrichomonas foetus]